MNLNLDDKTAFEFDSSATATAVADEGEGDALVESQSEAQAAEPAGPTCEKCAALMCSDGVAVCRGCGWYGSLNTFVEVDPNWEGASGPSKGKELSAGKSHLRVWFDLIPWWGWVIVGSVFAVVVESVIIRLVTGYGSSLRTTWSLTQLALGAFAAIVCHVANFMVQVTDDHEVGLFDILLKPVKLWLNTFRLLPSRLWIVDSAASGLTAALMAIVVIGGLPYDRLWDWGITPPPKQELMGAVMDRVKQLDDNGADNLDDAIGDFAGKGDLDEVKAPPKPRKSADCVILGYTLDNTGRLNTFVLGTAHLGRLVYAGNVTPKFSDESERREMLERLLPLRTTQRTLPIQTEAIWVRPNITCRVTYGERQTTGRLNDVQWETYLGTMRTTAKP